MNYRAIIGSGIAAAFFLGIPAAPAAAAPPVKIAQKQLMVDFDGDGAYTPFLVKGVGYGAIPVGAFPSQWGPCSYTGMDDRGKPQFDCPGANEYDNAAVLKRDLPLIKEMNANTIRTWGNVTPLLMDLAEENGLKVIAGFWIPYNLDYVNGNLVAVQAQFEEYVERFRKDPALLMWAVGYQNETAFCTFQNAGAACDRDEQAKAYYSFVNKLARRAKELEGGAFHPVMTLSADLGLIGKAASDDRLPDLDAHGCNLYRGPEFDNFFAQYSERSAKPVLISELGTDAWFVLNARDPRQGVERQDLQAEELAASWDTIIRHVPAAGGQALGGIVSPFADNWWRLNGEWSPSAAVHDYGFVPEWPTGADGHSNVEWFGLCALEPAAGPAGPAGTVPEKGLSPSSSIDRIFPRLAYTVMRHKFMDTPPERPWQAASGAGKMRTDIAWNYTAGYHFKPKAPGRITQLGGLFDGAKSVRLWDAESGDLLAQTEISSENKWKFTDVPPVTVQPGRRYTVAVTLGGSGGSQAYDIPSLPLTSGDVEIEASTFAFGGQRPVKPVPSQMFGQADITFVPETASGNHAPDVGRTLKVEPAGLKPGQQATVSVKATDKDGDALKYTWSTSGGTIEGDGASATYTAPDVTRNETYNIIAVVTDARGGLSYANGLVTVGKGE